MNGTQPVADFASLAALAGRISTHLAQNPHDQQAHQDLQYVRQQMEAARPVANAADPEASGSGITLADVGSGLVQAAADIPRGVATAVMHPWQTLGQVTGLGNVPHMVDVVNDPESSWAEKIGAVIQATPLNMGYAPERALLDATGATSDTPASGAEQVERMGNVGSLALLGVKPGAVGRFAVNRALGPIGRATGVTSRLQAVGRALAGIPETAAKAVDTESMTGFGHYADDPNVQAAQKEYLGRDAASRQWSARANANADADVAQADRDYAAGKITAEDQATAHSYAGRPMTAPAAAATQEVVPPAAAAGANPPRPTPIPGTGTNAVGGPQGLEVEGPPTPPVPSAPTVLETQEGQRYTPPGGTPKVPTDALPGLTDAQRKGLTDFANKEIATQKEVMGRTQRGMTGAQAAFRMNLGAGAEPVKAVASLTRSPIFGQAEILANRIAADPELQARFPEYQGLDAGAAKTLLLKQLVANAERGNTIPPLTSLGDFLEGLKAK